MLRNCAQVEKSKDKDKAAALRLFILKYPLWLAGCSKLSKTCSSKKNIATDHYEYAGKVP